MSKELKELRVIERFRQLGHGEFADRLLSCKGGNIENRREKEMRFLRDKINVMQSRLRQLNPHHS